MLDAFGCDQFEVGLLWLTEGGKRMTRHQWTRQQIINRLGWLRKQNAGGANINIMPLDKSFTLLDDLKADAIDRMVAEGFRPAVVVETSAANYQAWMRHHEPIHDSDLARMIAKDLARRFGADPGAAAHSHFGRLAGFTNQKQCHRKNGRYPLATLEASSGAVYAKSAEYLQEMADRLRRDRVKPIYIERRELRFSLSDYHAHYGDGHIADWRYARDAALAGVGMAEIAAALRTRPEIEKKDARYPEYTAKRALRSLGL